MVLERFELSFSDFLILIRGGLNLLPKLDETTHLIVGFYGGGGVYLRRTPVIFLPFYSLLLPTSC